MIDEITIKKTIQSLIQKYGDEYKDEIRTGVAQVARLWRQEDGSIQDFQHFCLENFITDPTEKKNNFQRLETAFEDLFGLLNELERALRWNIDVETGPILKVDNLISSINPGSHLQEDLFKSKVAFYVLLNYPLYNLKEMISQGKEWSRQKWAEVRLAQMFRKRIPVEIEQKIHQAFLNADNYIYNYNLYMQNLLNQKGKPLFHAPLKLISHWGLRDELKSQYNEPDGLPRQRLIYEAMKKIVTQEIPAAVINNPEVKWNVYSNEVIGASNTPENDRRYEKLLEVFQATRKADPYFPIYKSYIERKFNVEREIPEEKVRDLFETLLTSREFKETGRLIRKRLGRELEPFDIWYPGLKSGKNISEETLDSLVKERYPDIKAFYEGIPEILERLGFSREKARFIQSHIQVDPARGAGHAWGAQRKKDKAHLRTRVPENGMDYKGYNIAIHELGHNTEQVISLHLIDHTLLEGVPNTSFTEAFAFLFQSRDLELLGIAENAGNRPNTDILHQLWATCEIAGVALVDMEVWHWLYDNPEATAAELKKAVITIAENIWNQYFYPVLGHKDEPILAIYSHMINSALYLPDYPLGHIIHFQIEQYIKDKRLGDEMERMCKLGSITPELWMEKAVGSSISVEPMLQAARDILEKIDL